MIKNYIKFLILTILLSSCSTVGLDRTTAVNTTSSAVGGYLGYELSDGDILSTTIGSAVGVIVGSYLSDFFNKDDYYYYKNEAIKILEINDNNKSLNSGYWKNPKSGNKGVIIIKGHYGTPECRLLEHTFFLKSKPNKLLDTACREKSGQWAMIK